MVELLSVIVPIGLASIGGYIHMQVKTSKASQELIGVRELINERFDHFESKLDSKTAETDRRLDRLERSMNGRLLKE